MYQKDLVRNAWKSAGLYDQNDAKLQQFLQLLDDPAQCWSELIVTCRRNFADYKAKLVQPLMDSSDTLVHLMVIRAADGADELALLEQYISGSDPTRDEVELKTIALKNVPRLNRALAKKPNLTKPVSDALASPSATRRTARRPRPAPPTPAPPAPAPPAPAPGSPAPGSPG
jgi:hypothetical protein